VKDQAAAGLVSLETSVFGLLVTTIFLSLYMIVQF
jgi:hypothetical protein